jgi:hypothetical protein
MSNRHRAGYHQLPARFVSNAAGGRYSAAGGDADNTAVDIEEGDTGQRPLQRRRVAVPSSYEVPIWGTFHVNAARYNIGARSGTALVVILGVFFLWLVLWVPTLPEGWSWHRYCALYYFLQVPFYVVNLFFPLNIMVSTMYGVMALVNTCVFGFQAFLVFLFGYNYYHCWVGDLPYSCTDNYLIDLIMATLTVILAYVGLLTAAYFWSVAMRTSATHKPSLIEYLALN